MIQENEIRIRTIEEKDLAVIYKWNTPQMRGDYEGYQLESKKELEKEFEMTGFFKDSFKMLIVEEEYAPSGLAYLDFYRDGIVKIGLVLCEKSRGNNLGTRVTAMLTDYLWNNYTIWRIEADIDVHNAAAQKVMEKCGYEKEGVLRKYRFHHGKYHDYCIYSRVR